MADKVMHLQLYFWGGLFASLYFCRRKPAYLAALLFGMLYGASDEVHQLFVPLRSFSAADWLADICGVCLGIFTHWFYMIRFHEPRVEGSPIFHSHRTEVI